MFCIQTMNGHWSVAEFGLISPGVSSSEDSKEHRPIYCLQALFGLYTVAQAKGRKQSLQILRPQNDSSLLQSNWLKKSGAGKYSLQFAITKPDMLSLARRSMSIWLT